MKMSLRRFILINLLLGELLAITLGISTILFLQRQDTQFDLDNKLLESAFVVQRFMHNPQALKKIDDFEESLSNIEPTFHTPLYQYIEETLDDSGQFHFYVWDAQGRLLFGEQAEIAHHFSRMPLGFSQMSYKGEVWRTFASVDPKTWLKVVVLQKTRPFQLSSSKRFGQKVIIVMLISYLLLGLLTWVVLARGLNVLQKISNQVHQQKPEDLSPLDASNLPSEVKPLIEEWNRLFARLRLAFDREKRFAADAAHELKTPLAALKTHTQLALNAKNENELVNALHKIVAGVNRSAHVVHQLLTLSRMSQGGITESPTSVDMVQQAKDIILELVLHALEKESELELIAPETAVIQAYDTAVTILMRNLIDNAIRYSPNHSLIRIIIEESPDKQNILFKVVDNGPGIPENLRQRVFERFFRILGNKAAGSGLGLGIVQQIVDLHHAQISLETPESGRGLQVTVMFKKKI